MAKYIDVDCIAKEAERYNKENWDDLTWSSHMVYSFLLNAPKSDVIEVVRCKNCKWFKRYECDYQCSLFNGMVISTEDGFCSYGAVKE